MEATAGQLNDIMKAFGSVTKEACSIIAEGGSDNGKTFCGSFLVKIKRKGVFRFEDGMMTKRVK